MTVPEPQKKCLVPLRVIVVGAGIGGLSTAIALARRGHHLVVLESAGELLSVGAGVALPPTVRRWFESQGVLQPDDPSCVALDGIEIRQWENDELVVRTAANPVGKQNSIHHGDLQLALLSCAQQMKENIEIRFGARVADVDVAATSVVVGTTGEKLEGDVIIAADGVKSIIRPKVVPAEACKAEPTGEAAFRFTLPRKLVEGDEELLALVQRPWATRWDGPASHVVAYPVQDHRALNVVLIHPDIDYGYGNEVSWTTVAEKRHVVEAFKAWSPILHRLIDLAPDEVPNFRMLLYPPAPVWAKGSTILLGDACHAMLPYLGQGVAQAVEDATALAAVLSEIESKAQLPLAIRAYETSRKERVEQIQATTFKARLQLHLKDEEAKLRDSQRKQAAESKENSDVVKMQHSFWVWDAAGAAEKVLSSLIMEVNTAQ